MRWVDALKEWNKDKQTWCIPRKGTKEYNEVMAIRGITEKKKSKVVAIKELTEEEKKRVEELRKIISEYERSISDMEDNIAKYDMVELEKEVDSTTKVGKEKEELRKAKLFTVKRNMRLLKQYKKIVKKSMSELKKLGVDVIKEPKEKEKDNIITDKRNEVLYESGMKQINIFNSEKIQNLIEKYKNYFEITNIKNKINRIKKIIKEIEEGTPYKDLSLSDKEKENRNIRFDSLDYIYNDARNADYEIQQINNDPNYWKNQTQNQKYESLSIINRMEIDPEDPIIPKQIYKAYKKSYNMDRRERYEKRGYGKVAPIMMTRKAFETEHKKLIDLLDSISKLSKAEADEQKKEVAKVRGGCSCQDKSL